jgi:hypothetical protein
MPSYEDRDDQFGEARLVPPLMIAAWEGAISERDPLAALGATRALASLLSTWESQLVSEAIDAGATWEVVGGTVGVSRQAAWERFHRDVSDFRREVKAEVRNLRNRHRHEARDLRQKIMEQAQARRRS